jgi:hypothetical protein
MQGSGGDLSLALGEGVAGAVTHTVSLQRIGISFNAVAIETATRDVILSVIAPSSSRLLYCPRIRLQVSVATVIVLSRCRQISSERERFCEQDVYVHG